MLSSSLGEGFPQHIGADEGQQNKSDPMIEALDGLSEQGTQGKAQGGHQALKSAEPGTADRTFLPGCVGGSQALTDRYGKCVHAQAYRQQEQLPDTHKTKDLRVCFTGTESPKAKRDTMPVLKVSSFQNEPGETSSVLTRPRLRADYSLFRDALYQFEAGVSRPTA